MASPDYMKLFRDRAAASKGRSKAARLDAMDAALWEYEQARCLVPIWSGDLDDIGDPMACRRSYPPGFAALILNACDDGADVQDVFDALFSPPDKDTRYGYLWRPMRPEERATPGQLLGMMSKASREKAVEILGAAQVATHLVKGGGLQFLKHST